MSNKKSRIAQLRDVTETQGRHGTWNLDPYMHGLFNGLELALAIHENRDPSFREAPEQWLSDRPEPSEMPEPVSEQP